MSKKDDFKGRMFVKIPVIIGYGDEQAKQLARHLKSQNSEEKLSSMKEILDMNLTEEQKLFVIQKLLAIPKTDRLKIAKKIESYYLDKEESNEDNN